MSDDAEKRFERAMDRLFSSPAAATPASSSVGAQSPAKGKGRIQMGNEGLIAPKASPTSRLGGCPPRTTEILPAYSISHINPHPVCRPWDRGDLFRRLATFRSMTWFGKPEVVGPVKCARKGWVNVDADLIACESCDAKLSFSSPPTWSQQQVESAAAAFSEKLDIGHKALCPWKGNVCSETLAQFPPTPVEALVEGFKDRCDALYQLSSLPVIKKSAVDKLRLLKGPQIDQLLAQSVPGIVLPVGLGRNDAESTGEEPHSAYLLTYFQAQRLISLCGWEPRLLPYIVDYEADSTQSTRRSIYGTTHDEVKFHRHSEPIVLLRSGTARSAEKIEVHNEPSYSQQGSDVKSAVLDCNLCGASIGLWLFFTIARPSMWTSAQLGDIIKIGSEPSACGFSAVSGIDRDDKNRKPQVVKPDGSLEGVTSCLPQSGSRTGVLDLKLTIAGGPPPTRLNSFGSKPSCYSPNPLNKPRIPQPESSESGRHQGQGVENQVCNTNKKQMSTILHTDKAGFTNLHNNVANDPKGDTLQSLQYEHTGDFSSIMICSGIEKEADGMKRKRKRNDHNGLEDRQFLENSCRDLPRYSSVDAMDTSFHSRRENSAESVEMPQEAESQGTAISGYNNDLVSQAQQDTSGQASGRHLNVWVSSKNNKGDVNENNVIINASADKTCDTIEGSKQWRHDGKCDRQTGRNLRQHTILPEGKRVKKVTDATEVTRNIKQTSEVIFDENQGVLPNDVIQQFGSVNDVAIIEGNTGESRAQSGKNIEVLNPLKDKRMAPTEAFRPDVGPESSVGAMSAEERTFDSSVLWEPETNEFDPVSQHRHFCPWINENSTRQRSGSDNQYGSKCGWQLTLDALETSPVMAESESASSIYNTNPLASVRKVFGRTQTSQKKSK